MTPTPEQIKDLCRQEATAIKDLCRKLGSYLLNEAKGVEELSDDLPAIQQAKSDDESVVLLGLWSMVSVDPDLETTIYAVVSALTLG